MGQTVVTAIGVAAIGIAVAIVVRWGGLDTSKRAAADVSSGVGGALRRLCVIEISGLVAGLLVGGLGGRLMMRIMAATSTGAAQGRITDAGEIVGRVTVGGTIGFLIFVGIGFGLVGAGVYWIAASFMPRRAWLAGGLLGLLLLGVLARLDPLRPENPDFTILSPPVLAVVLIAGLFVLYGMTVVSLAARLERAYPRFEVKSRSVVAFAPLLFMLLPPFTIALVAAVAVGLLKTMTNDAGRDRRWTTVHRVGTAAVVVATIAGNVWLGFGIADILA